MLLSPAAVVCRGLVMVTSSEPGVVGGSFTSRGTPSPVGEGTASRDVVGGVTAGPVAGATVTYRGALNKRATVPKLVYKVRLKQAEAGNRSSGGA
jgi:hypothetical protein